MPSGDTATPDGRLKLAAVPVPSAEPDVSEPASVVVAPPEVSILRIRLLEESAT